ncbi:hypothetical protein BLA39750_01040 [Burkholderia lata]|uniref:Uncharacterized protein n=1 Tax=Burkholderia lata (strain ATCC 17760 / DSM 23089 / LMG 22485 / NCIMB 9086 / R18194 / 383) TaxID=482957 RepID=A0A6P2VAS1_BURL3|nr:hypothetical protein [Burkholderia lata]VWC78726.1 hypothetical protein BLA39750_01040 [Burkholderia lata]
MESPAASYLTDDRDLPEDEQRRLVIFFGGNGDLYIQVAPKNGPTFHGVRLATSGGASMHCPGLVPALADAYRAMKAAEAGVKLAGLASREELDAELRAWRARFPDLTFDGLSEIVDV